VLDRLLRSGTNSPVVASASSPISPKAPPGFGIKTLDELMKERQQSTQQGQAANLATSAGARTEPEAKKQKREQIASTPAPSSTTTPATQAKPSPSVIGQKRKLDATSSTPTHPATTTPTAKASTPTPAAVAKTTPAAKAEEESFDDLEKELEELGVVIEEGEEIDLGLDLELGE